MMSTGSMSSFSDSLVLDDSGNGVIITGITDAAVAAKSGLQAGDEIVAATVHLDHLKKKDVLTILKVLEPYDDNMTVVTKKDLKARAGAGSMGLHLNGPAQMLNLKKDLSLDALAEAPAVSSDGQSGNLNAALGFGNAISGPTLNGDLPRLGLKKPSADAGAKLKLPSAGLSGDLDGAVSAPNVSVASPKLKMPKLKTGNLAYNTPKFTMPNFNLPRIKTPTAGLDASGGLALPSVSGNLDGPNVNLSAPKIDLKSSGLDLNTPNVGLNGPNINLGTPNLGLNGPNVNLDTPNLGLNGPNVNLDTPNLGLNGPNVNLGTPNLGLNGPNVNLGTPNLGLNGPNVNLGTPNLGLNGPNVNLDTPNLGLNGPNVNLGTPNLGLNGPNVNLDTPNFEIGAPSGKYKWPHEKWNLKFPKVKGHNANLKSGLSTPDANLSVPTLDGNVTTPGVDLDLPKSAITGPDVQTTNLDIEAPSGGIHWPHLKWKKPKLHGPNADLDLDASLNTPDACLPKVEGGLNSPDVDLNLPSGDVQGPNLDLQTPNLDMDLPSGKFIWPHQKLRKPKAPKADLSIYTDPITPNLNLSTPKIEGDVNVPDAELNLPKADLNGKGLDVQGPGIDVPTVKTHKPLFKWMKPKLHGPKADLDLNPDLSIADGDVSIPAFDGSISSPDVDMSLPQADLDVKPLDGDIEVPTGKVKFPTIKKPKFNLFAPKVKTPDFDAEVKAPDLHVAPLRGSIDGLDGPNVGLNLPQTDLDVNVPSADIESPSGKLNLKKPTFKLPRWSGPKANGPDVDLDAAVALTPDLSLSAPNLDAGINAPDGTINLPHLEGPKMDINAPDANINLPDLEGPGIDLIAPDVESPSGKFKWFPNFKKPKVGTLKGPKAGIDADIKVPAVDAPHVNLSTPDVNLSVPKVEGGIDSADVNIGMPTADVKGPSLDLDAPDGRLHLPKFNLKKLTGPKVKGGELDANLKAPGIDVSPNVALDTADLSFTAPKVEGGFDATDINVREPDVNLPDPDIDASGGKLKFPRLNLPKFGFLGPRVNVPDLNADADLKGPELSAPKISGAFSTPGLQADPTAKISLPDMSAPNITGPGVDANLTNPDVKGPSLDLPNPDLSIGDLNLNPTDFGLSLPNKNGNLSGPITDYKFEAPDVKMGTNRPKADFKGPDAQVKTPFFGLDSNLGDFKLPGLKVPSLGLSSPEVQAPIVPSIESGVEAPKINMDISKADTSVSFPAVDGDLDVKAPNLDANLEKPRLPLFKIPSIGLSSSDVEVPSVSSIDSGVETPNLSIPTADANITVPNVPKVEGNITGPQIDAKAPNVDVSPEKSKFKLPKFNFLGSKVETPEVDTGANLEVSPDASVKIPSVDGEISSPLVSASAPEVETNLKLPGQEAEVKSSSKDKLKRLFKWGIRHNSGTDDEGSGVDSETDLNSAEAEIPTFKFHKLPQNSVDGGGEVSDIFASAKLNTETKDYVVSKGVRLPVVNPTTRTSEKIDIMERLKMAKDKSTAITPTGKETNIDLKLATPSLNVGAPTAAGDSSLVRGGTFKVENPASSLNLVKPAISTSDENDKLSMSLSNMLVLNASE